MADDGRPTGEWGEDWVTSLCHHTREDPPEPCDCGYVGIWEFRWWYQWEPTPGRQRGNRAIRADLARGFPARHGDEGYWCKYGWDERCPGCGDIERFDLNGVEIDRFRVVAVVTPLRPYRR